MLSALTRKTGKIANCLKTPVRITNPKTGASIETLGIWDTGATSSAITKSAAKQLGLIPVQMTYVRGIGGLTPTRIYNVSISMNDGAISLNARVTECEELTDVDDTGMLIGMNIVNMGDLCITNFKGNTQLTFRTPSLETVDYVEELKEFDHIYKVHEAKMRHGDDKCPCGSGKKFKNCHAQSKYNL